MPELPDVEHEDLPRAEALCVVADWLADPDFGSGWGGPRRERDMAGIESLARGLAAREDAASDADADPQAAGQAKASGAGGEEASFGDDIDLAEDSRLASACARCGLATTRRKVAYGEGAARPLVLVVGEGPGAEEDAQGRPFVGPAGQLLDRMLGAIGLSREENCYIANVVKCRPPANRDPEPGEREACMPWLERQIAALQPAVILAMGRVGATTLLESKEGINRLRGRWFERHGIPLIATFHPSALLRDESLKRPAWEDLKLLRGKLDAIAVPGTGEAGAGATAGTEGQDGEATSDGDGVG